LIKDYQKFKNIKTEQTANAKKDYELLIAAQKIIQQEAKQGKQKKGKQKKGQNQLLSPQQIDKLKSTEITEEVIKNLPSSTPISVVQNIQQKIKDLTVKQIAFEDEDKD
jgi:hypothetical protein